MYQHRFIPGLIAALLMVASAPSPAGGWNYRIGEDAPAIKLKDLQGKTLSSADLRGQFVVVSFMTTWCPFCNAAAPYFEQLNKTYGPRGVRALMVDVDEEPKAVAKFVKKHGLSCTTLLDADATVTKTYAPPPDFVPDLKREEVMIASFLIIDPEGKIRFLSLNEDTANFDARLTKLRARLDELLAAR